jgi:MFS transporter, SP family, galactose:H+ symporter
VILLVFVISFQMSTGNVSWIYFAEACVDSGMGFVLAAIQGSNILMAFTVSYKIDSALRFEGTFWLYAGLNLLCVLFLVIFVKETKGLTTHELKNLYIPVTKVADEPPAIKEVEMAAVVKKTDAPAAADD